MRVLLITLPHRWREDRLGYHWKMLRALAEEGHQVELVSFAPPRDNLEGLAALKERVERLELVRLRVRNYETGDYLPRLLALPRAWPYSALRWVSKEMAACLQNRLKADRFDAVLCDQMYPVVNLPLGLSVPIIADTQHVLHVLLQRYAQHMRHPLERIYASTEAGKMRRWEAQMSARVAVVGVCSELEGDLFRALSPGVKVVMIPNVVEVEQYCLCPETGGSRILFCATMDWFPNQDAVDFFANKVMPPLRSMASDFTFVAAGRNPPASFTSRFESVRNIEFTGTVPDMRVEIARASVCVVPLRIATGTRVKILEAAAMAKPIVSTRIGAEGLDFVDGSEIMLADDPHDFARAVADLLADPDHRRALGQAARRRVEQQYSLMALRDALRTALAVGSAQNLNKHIVSVS